MKTPLNSNDTFQENVGLRTGSNGPFETLGWTIDISVVPAGGGGGGDGWASVMGLSLSTVQLLSDMSKVFYDRLNAYKHGGWGGGDITNTQ